MTTITTRAGKGSPLTNNEMDANLTGLNDDKVEASGDSMTGDLSFGDNNKVILGSGNDLQLYHDANDSYISDQGSGNLKLLTDEFRLRNAADSDHMLTGSQGGAITAYHNGTARLATTSTGIDVTGTAVTDGLTVAGTAQFDDYGGTTGKGRIHFGNSGQQFIEGLDTGNGGSGAYLRFGYGSTEAVRIDSSGVVQIGPSGSTGDRELRFETGSGSASGEDAIINSYRSNADLILKTNDTERMRIDASGNVGIGTTSPSFGLSVESDNGSGYAALFRKSSSDPALTIQTTSGTTQIQGLNSALNATYGIAMQVSGGNVGIGTASPSSSLHVSSTASSPALFERTGSTGAYIGLKDSSGSLVYLGDNNGTFEVQTAGSSYATKLAVTSAGNVGVGTSSPRYNLAVSGNNATAIGIALDNASGSGTADISILGAGYASHQAGAGEVWFYSPDNINIGGATGNTNNIKFLANNKINMFIEGSSGNVGIGAAAPAFYQGSGLEIERAGIATLRLQNSTTAKSAELKIDSDLTLEAINTGSNLLFNTTATERMRIDSSGAVRVGKTNNSYVTVGIQLGTYSNNSIDNTTQFTHDNSGGTSMACTAPVSESLISFYRQDTGGFMGHIRNDSSNSVSYFTSSDERLKENIVDAPSASDDIDAIQIRSFDWKADGSHQKYGVIAQELNNVIPSAVDMTQDDNRHASVDYSKLVPMLVKEIQSLRARVAQLEGAN